MSFRLFCIFLLLRLNSFSQDGFAIELRGLYSRLQFPLFENYVSSYNEVNKDYNGFEPLKYNPNGLGIQTGIHFNSEKFFSAIFVSKNSTLPSNAHFQNGYRSFRFLNNTFDVVFGPRIKFVIPYFTLSINSMNIESYYTFNDGTKSYGSEFAISGIYSSFKMFVGFGLRFEKKFNHFGFSVDGCYPINSKKYLNGTFDKQTNSTDAPYFPQKHTDYGSLDSDLMLPQNYRNIRFGLGLIYYIKK